MFTPNEDYLITPKFENADPACGLDEADIVELAGHILGTFPFTGPWQYVAADFNLDNAVTNIDQILIKKAILYNEFPEGYSKPRQNAQLDTGHWPPGVYYYRCSEGNQNYSGKLVKGLRNNKLPRIGEVILCAYKAKNVGIVGLRRGFSTPLARKRTSLNG